MKRTESNLTTKIIIVTIILLCVTNILLSVILLHNTRMTSKALINERMLDIANCAAATINGDHLKVLTADDTDTPEYQSVYNSLAVFRDNINKQHLKYIYCAYQGDDGEFYFSIDPSNDAAPFGQKIIHSDGIYEAIKGTPAVDTKPYSDEWGTFYSAYSPVYDSEKNVAGLVIVDFDASWYSNQVASDMGMIIFVCAFSVLINVVAIIMTTSKLRNSLSRLYTEMDILGDDIYDLTADSNAPDTDVAAINHRESGDALTDTVLRIRALQKKIRVYIAKVKSQAFCDSLTGVGNRTAFAERTDELNKLITEDEYNADFAIAVFDINGLKHINDDIGHEAGDSIIKDTAAALKEVFGLEHVYRIGGDEFIAILNYATAEDMESLLEKFDRKLDDTNKKPERKAAPLYVSKGVAVFHAGIDSHFNDVFKNADGAMYNDKEAFYKRKDQQSQ